MNREFWLKMRRVRGYKALRSLVIGRESEQWLRIVMDQATLCWVKELPHCELNVAEVSGTRWMNMLTFRSYDHFGYPEWDLCQTPLPRQFDLVIAEQVFEHLAYPGRAAVNVLKSLKPGGWFLITAPFLVRFHPQPLDCTRWSVEGLKFFLEDAGFESDTIRTQSWGNRACLKANLLVWRKYQPWMHSLKNDPAYPLVVWGMARKPTKVAD